MRRVVMILATVAMAGGVCLQAQAEFLYDFSNCTSGSPLAGQDGWTSTNTYTQVSSGASGWSGNYVTNTLGDSISFRENGSGSGWSFSLLDNVATDFSCQVLVNSDKNYAKACVKGDNGGVWFGVQYNTLQWLVDGTTKSETVNLTNTIVRVGMTLTPTGNDNEYSCEEYYQIGDEKTVVNTLTTNNYILSEFDELVVRVTQKNGGMGMLDDIRINQVPEPSTAVLIIAGMAGLCAFARRKRK